MTNVDVADVRAVKEVFPVEETAVAFNVTFPSDEESFVQEIIANKSKDKIEIFFIFK